MIGGDVMPKIITFFNNKGGVAKTTNTWNIGHELGCLGKKILLVDFDPQCNLSIAMIGNDELQSAMSITTEAPQGKTIKTFLQGVLQGSNNKECHLFKGKHTSANVDLIVGDFWLNIYSDSLSVGADILTGHGLRKYVALRELVSCAEAKQGYEYDFVIIDLPPSFGALVRATFYSSDYFIVPCTSDTFCSYCVGLIGEMIPLFIKDWDDGLKRYQQASNNDSAFDSFGKPKFAGWVFNSFDTSRIRRTAQEIEDGVPEKEKVLQQADETLKDHIKKSILNDLVGNLKKINEYNAVVENPGLDSFYFGGIEDANVLTQNSVWLNVPLGELKNHRQVVDLQNRRAWAANQLAQIELLKSAHKDIAEKIIRICL